MGKKHVPYGSRPEWADVAPVEQNDGPSPPCQIAYSEEFKDTHNFFRAVLLANEHSPRAFDITTHALKLNPANYTAWYFRRKVTAALFLDADDDNSTGDKSSSGSSSDLALEKLREDRAFAGKMGEANPKNYQIWFHRRWLAERLKEQAERAAGDDGVADDNVVKEIAREELRFASVVLADDNKNYHTWAHRQWVVETFALWDEELAYTQEMAELDVLNNSAWNQRMFVVTRKNTLLPLADDVREREADWAIEYARKRPNNECPWVYLKGLYRSGSGSGDSEASQFDYAGGLTARLEELMGKYVTSPHPAALMVDVLEHQGTAEAKTRAAELCENLEKAQDNIHARYWRYRREQITGSAA